MYGARPTTDFDETAFAAENERLRCCRARPARTLSFSVRPGPRCSWPRRTRRSRPSACACGLPRRTWRRRQRRAQAPAMTVMRATMTSRARRGALPERSSFSPESSPRKLTIERGYTTKDLTALRGYAQRILPAVIARTYYDPDEDAHAATPRASTRTVGWFSKRKRYRDAPPCPSMTMTSRPTF